MKGKLSCGVAALILFDLVASASGEIVTESFTGFVTQGTDLNNIFGLSGQSLVNQAYMATYTFDLSLGSGLVQIVPGTPALGGYYTYYANTVYGGTGTSYPTSALISSSLTINDISFDMGGSYFGQLLGT